MSMPGLLLSLLYPRLSTEGLNTIGWHRCTGLMMNPAWGITCVTTVIAGTVVWQASKQPGKQTALSCPCLGLHAHHIIAEPDQPHSL